MRESRVEVLTGAAVLLAALGFLAYALTGSGASNGGYPLTASFRSVEGIDPGSRIRLGGVVIGKVGTLVLDPETFRVDATLLIDDEIPIPEDSTASISSDGLLGGAYIEIVPGGSYTELAPGDEILDTQGAVSLIGLLMQFISAKEGS